MHDECTQPFETRIVKTFASGGFVGFSACSSPEVLYAVLRPATFLVASTEMPFRLRFLASVDQAWCMRAVFAAADELSLEKELWSTACDCILAIRWDTAGCNQLAFLADGDSTVMRSNAFDRASDASS